MPVCKNSDAIRYRSGFEKRESMYVTFELRAKGDQKMNVGLLTVFR
jgi:hypothetical protein